MSTASSPWPPSIRSSWTSWPRYRTLESFDNAHIYPTVLDAVTAFRSAPDPSSQSSGV